MIHLNLGSPDLVYVDRHLIAQFLQGLQVLYFTLVEVWLGTLRVQVHVQ